MASDQTTKVFGITSAQLTITADGHVGITGGPYCNTIMLSYMSGSTTAVVGSSGISYTLGWVMNATPLIIGGPGPIWITAAGSTSKVNIIKTLSSVGDSI